MTATAWDCMQRIRKPDALRTPWITTPSREVTYGQLAERIDRLAALMAARAIGLGERVVIATRDDAEAALLFVALVCNGVTVVQLDAGMAQPRAQALIAKAQPRLLIVDEALRRQWALDGAGVEVIDITAPAKEARALFGLRMAPAAKTGLAAVLDALPRATPPSAIPPETLAYILFTSGTTREPKGVCISHRALFSHLATLSRVYGYTPQSRILNTLMLSHADGMIQGPVITFFNGARLLRPMAFEITALERLLDSVFQLRITHMVAVPTMLSLMERLVDRGRDAFQGGDFQLLISCGAALEPALWEAFEAKFGVSILNVYGLTETVVGGVFAGKAVGVGGYGGIGVPVDCELKIIGDDGEPVAGGAVGELAIRGSLLMSGYFGDEGQTAAVLHDGWLRTGDLARRDGEGCYWIAGRKKNIVIRGGLNIHPEEIAEALNRHPRVSDAVAFGVPDPEWGETLVALVAGDGVTERELLSHCAALLEPRKAPSRVIVVDALPKGRSGKVVLEEARALFHRPAAAAAAFGGGGEEERLLDIAARTFKIERAQVRLTSTPADVLGWDSLAHLDLVSAIEAEFGVGFTPRQIMDLNRLGDALAVIRGG